MKKILFISIPALIIFGAVFLFYREKTASPKKQTGDSLVATITPTPLPILIFNEDPPQETAIKTVVFDGTAGPQPQTLPIYKAVEAATTMADARAIASKFSFPSTPTIATAGGSLYYTWGTAQQTWLSIKKTGYVYFKINLPEKRSPVTIDPPGAALSFLQKLSLISAPVSYAQREVAYYKASPPTLSAVSGANEADTIIILFTYKLNGLPFYLSPSLSWDASVTIQNNMVSALSLQLPPRVTIVNTAEIIPPSIAIDSLQKGRGLLARIEQKIQGERAAEETVVSAGLHEASLIYFYDKTNGVIRPAYLFSGEGIDEKGSLSKVFYLVSATSVF